MKILDQKIIITILTLRDHLRNNHKITEAEYKDLFEDEDEDYKPRKSKKRKQEESDTDSLNEWTTGKEESDTYSMK